MCIEELRDSNPLKEYPPLSSKGLVLDLCGLTDEKGKVLDYSGEKTPIFSPKHLSTMESWENLAFAFYFPPEQVLLCNKDDVAEGNIDHEPDRCLKKRPPKHFVKWVCPNEL